VRQGSAGSGCSSDHFILSEFRFAPALSVGDGHTAPADFFRQAARFWSWRFGGNEGRSTRRKKELKLSEIIMEINDLRKVRPRSQSTETGPPATSISRRLPLTSYPQFQRASANALLTSAYYHI
jgi:hypothetical protein